MRLRGVGVRLSIALLLVVALALGIVYVVVVPQLRHRLISAKLHSLERAAPSVARGVPTNRFVWDDYAQNASQSVNARVVIYDVIEPPVSILVEGDSNQNSADVQNDPIAEQAAASAGRRLTFILRPCASTFTARRRSASPPRSPVSC